MNTKLYGLIGTKVSTGPSGPNDGAKGQGVHGPRVGVHGPTPIGPIGPRRNGHIGPGDIGPFGPKVDFGLASFLDVLAGKTKANTDGPGTNGPNNGEAKERVSFSSLLEKAQELDDTRLTYTAPTVLDDGSKVVDLTVDMVERGSRLYMNQLYGYFIGTSMDFRAVQASVRRLWRKYDFESMGKNTAGFYFFKFKSEEGMLSVLRDGPWLVDQVPLFLHQWEPGITLTKVEPKKVQIWVAIHDMSPDLWNGECIGVLASRIGRPCFMDRPTTERCVKQTGRINYARVLVEIDARDEVPSEVQVRYPPIRGREGFVKCLRVSYQWKPKRCSICEVFGHSTLACKHNPNIQKDQPKGDGANTAGDTTNRVDEEGFVRISKKDKGKAKVVTSIRQEYRVRHDPKDPPKVAPPTAQPKDPTPPRLPKATTPKGITPSTHPSPSRDCTLNSHNRFEVLSDDNDDDVDEAEDAYSDDFYPDDNPTGKFMELEDRYA